MIESLSITDRRNTPVTWWDKIPAFRSMRTFIFHKGLTILWGPNGSGKSTLLRALARMTACEQGGTAKVTEDLLGHFMGRPAYRAGTQEYRTGMEIVADGQPCFFYDPSSSPGLVGGGGAFDYDFMDGETLSLAMMRRSSGQTYGARLARIVQAAVAPEATIDWGRFKGGPEKAVRSVNEVWSGALKIVVDNLAPKCEVGPRTLLLDEPDRSFDVPNQVDVWKWLPMLAKRLQVIVASHNPLALKAEGATWLEMRKGYRRLCLKALKEIGG